ncbi:MAG: hypothetical protein KDK37_19185, partial [Leptospiraceae bacterium]|nr:hypothetical protein [Leptospiraceae bacterium]
MNKVRNFSLSGTASVAQLGEYTQMGGMPIFADSGYQIDFYRRFFLRIRGNGYWLRHEQDQAEFATDFVDPGTAFTKAGTGYFDFHNYWRFYGLTSVGYGFQSSQSGLRIEPTIGYGFESYSMTAEGNFFGITNALNGLYTANEHNQLRGFWPSYSAGLKFRYLAQNGIEVYLSADVVYARGNLDLTIERFSAGVILGLGLRGGRYTFRKEGYAEELGIYIPLAESLDVSVSIRGQQENFFLENGDYYANTAPVIGAAPPPFIYYFGAPLPSKLVQKSNSLQIGLR